MNPTAPTVRRAGPVRERGVVLLVALVLLVLIGFLSTMIMRNALFGDLIANNLKQSQTATYVADVALRYCENLVTNNGAVAPTARVINPAPATGDPTLWRVEGNWNNAAMVTPVPLSQFQPAQAGNTAGVTMAFNRPPACIIEVHPLRSTKLASPSGRLEPPSATFQITARGFGPDYRAPILGIGGAGSEVLLQTTLRLFCNSTSWYAALCQ